jgi:hypothetical protein
MHKPARTIPLRSREIISGLHEAVRNNSFQTQLDDMRSELRGLIRGLENRVATLELENYALRNWIAANETGVRTHAERKDAMAGLVADCGRADDAG